MYAGLLAHIIEKLNTHQIPTSFRSQTNKHNGKIDRHILFVSDFQIRASICPVGESRRGEASLQLSSLDVIDNCAADIIWTNGPHRSRQNFGWISLARVRNTNKTIYEQILLCARKRNISNQNCKMWAKQFKNNLLIDVDPNDVISSCPNIFHYIQYTWFVWKTIELSLWNRIVNWC